MDLEYPSDYADFKDEVNEFLNEHWVYAFSSAAERRASEREFRLLATEKGYLYRGFPRRLGGSEQQADPLRAQIIREAFEIVRAPMEMDGIGVAMVAPTLLDRGKPWQQDMFIPGTLTGDIRWAQGYSEPNAGSDLASLRTRAELRGGEWIINGHKIWTTRAYKCTHMFALVRTEPDAPKHEGISYMLLRLDQPGVTVRRIHQISGESEFCEVFLDDVRTPADWIVGNRGEGWDVSRTTLKHERNMIGSQRSLKLLGALKRLASTCELDGRPAMEDAQIADRILAVEGHVMAQSYSGYYQFTRSMEQESAGIHGLMNKLAATEIGLRIAEIASDIIADRAFGLPMKNELSEARWLNQIFGSLALSIAGGTSNIQRNVIAERGLGLPRTKSAQS